jgi:hypothetical protein
MRSPLYESGVLPAPDLQQWIQTLKDWGLKKVDLFTGLAELEKRAKTESARRRLLQKYQLILLDHEFRKGDKGTEAEAIARAISQAINPSLDPKAKTAPILIKFSALGIERSEEERLAFLEKVEFPRGCYAFMPKSMIKLPGFERQSGDDIAAIGARQIVGSVPAESLQLSHQEPGHGALAARRRIELGQSNKHLHQALADRPLLCELCHLGIQDTQGRID